MNTCKHYGAPGDSPDAAGRKVCQVIPCEDAPGGLEAPAATVDVEGYPFGASSWLSTKPNFGCVLWEVAR